MLKQNDEIVGERLDRLMTVEIRPLSGGLPAGYVAPMYAACRRHHGLPLTTLAARKLIEAVKPGSTVLIATGAGIAPKLPLGETDGPPGAAVLARALVLGFGVKAILVTEDAHMPPVAAVTAVVNDELGRKGKVAVESFPMGAHMGQVAAEYLVREYNPTAVLFVERDGPNVEGHFHGVRGDCREPEQVAHVYQLAAVARSRGILSIGIGDGGNEVGFGAVRDEISAVHPLRAKCLRGCESGVVTTAATDVVVSASVSNWGAYAVAAALASALAKPELIHSPELERGLIEATVKAGARDGATSLAECAVDGIDWQGHASFVGLLNSIVTVSR
nr:glutamate cyclase domain-containing protein [uncultured Cupriavidus sp.]